MWTVRKVCTKCNKLFTAPDKSMRQLCGSCIKYSYANAGTTNLKRNTYLLRTYNISDQDYRQLLHNQNGVCAICGRPPKRGTRLHVDHDHTGLRVRGLLCTGCNTRLGWYEIHKAGVDLYLRKR
jgi:ribosomal protein S27AE